VVAGVVDEGLNSPKQQLAQQMARRAALDRRCDEVNSIIIIIIINIFNVA